MTKLDCISIPANIGNITGPHGPSNYSDAREYCEQQGLKLLTIDSLEEENYVAGTLNPGFEYVTFPHFVAHMEQFSRPLVPVISNFLLKIPTKTMILFLIPQTKCITFNNTTDGTCRFICK